MNMLYAVRYPRSSRMVYAARKKEAAYAIHSEQRPRANEEEYRIAK
jgi:hypothetical protein